MKHKCHIILLYISVVHCHFIHHTVRGTQQDLLIFILKTNFDLKAQTIKAEKK